MLGTELGPRDLNRHSGGGCHSSAEGKARHTHQRPHADPSAPLGLRCLICKRRAMVPAFPVKEHGCQELSIRQALPLGSLPEWQVQREHDPRMQLKHLLHVEPQGIRTEGCDSWGAHASSRPPKVPSSPFQRGHNRRDVQGEDLGFGLFPAHWGQESRGRDGKTTCRLMPRSQA